MKSAEKARGKWRGILLALKVDDRFLTGKHGPCPFCEGENRFRWDNSNGNGSFICNQCGAGAGFEFLKRFHGWDFITTAKEVDAIVGNVVQERPKQQQDEKARANMLNKLWASGVPLTGKDPASAYLAGRGVLPAKIPSCLRFVGQCHVPYGGGDRPAMIALVLGSEGNPVNIHRTYLGPNGKADMANPRAMMPGKHPLGSAVRLYTVHGESMGIAEGIETAIAAAKRFKMPVWAALNSAQLTEWNPPIGITSLTVFGDCDKAYGGQLAAYALSHRLVTRNKLLVEVKIPDTLGKDWADIDGG